MKRLMRFTAAMLAAILLLSTPVYAMNWSTVKQELFSEEQWELILNNKQIRDLMESEQVQKLFNDEAFRQQVSLMMDDLDDIIDQIRGMSDEELRQTITALAQKYNIPELNEEQMRFLVSLCRGLEKADDVGDTVQEYGEKVSKFRQTVNSVIERLQQVADTFSRIAEQLSGILGSKEATE